MKLSILITTITERVDSHFPRLVTALMKQIGDRKDIEILGFLDNRRRTVGVKRQDLLEMAKGEYLVYFDDDDTPADDYIDSIMAILDGQPSAQVDSVVFKVRYKHLGTGKQLLCEYDKDFKGRAIGKDGIWRGPSCHIHVTRSDVAKSVRWLERPPGKQWNIDAIWSDAVAAKLQHQVKIDKVLYFYNFNPSTSETLKRNRGIQGR